MNKKHYQLSCSKEIALMKQKTTILIAVLLIMMPASVLAEGFSDLYIGYAQSQDQDISGSVGNITTKAEFEGGISAGYRIGYWPESIPFVGFAMEISYLEQNIKDEADLRVIPITPLLMLRIPLFKSDEFPYGEWQPYLGVGPGIFMSTLKPEAGDDDYGETDVGLDARCGVKWFLVHNFGLFLEYRYTQFSPEFDAVIQEFDVQTHHALFGISVNF